MLYLDDMLIMDQDRDRVERQLATAVELLISLGFIGNLKKSVTMPTQEIQFLGFSLNSQAMMITLPQSKLYICWQGQWERWSPCPRHPRVPTQPVRDRQAVSHHQHYPISHFYDQQGGICMVCRCGSFGSDLPIISRKRGEICYSWSNKNDMQLQLAIGEKESWSSLALTQTDFRHIPLLVDLNQRPRQWEFLWQTFWRQPTGVPPPCFAISTTSQLTLTDFDVVS